MRGRAIPMSSKPSVTPRARPIRRADGPYKPEGEGDLVELVAAKLAAAGFEVTPEVPYHPYIASRADLCAERGDLRVLVEVKAWPPSSRVSVDAVHQAARVVQLYREHHASEPCDVVGLLIAAGHVSLLAKDFVARPESGLVLAAPEQLDEVIAALAARAGLAAKAATSS